MHAKQLKSLFLALLLLLSSGPLGWSAEGGDNDSGNVGIAGQPIWDGTGTFTLSGLTTSPAFYNLNGLPQTIVRATSAYDPVNAVISAPGVLRSRLIAVGGKTFNAYLIEGPRTNLLAAGSSDRITPWTKIASDAFTDGAVAGPNGELIIGKYQEGSATGFHTVAQSVAVSASSLPYTWSFYLQALPGNLTTKIIQIDDVATNGVHMTVNTTTGTITSAAAAVGAGWTAASGSMVAWGNGWRITLTGTTAAATTVRCIIWDNGIASTAGDSVSGFYKGMDCLEQAAFPSTPISNRNLLTVSQTLASATWVKTASTVTDGAALGPDGLLSLSKLKEDSTTASHLANNPGTATVGTGAITFSCLAGSAERTFIALYFGAAGKGKFFNLGAGTVGGNLVAAPDNAAITATSRAGIYRCSITLNVSVAQVQNCSIYLSTDGVTFSYAGTTGNGAYVGCAQLEYGTTATAYWGVNATVGGRDADSLSVSLAGITDTRTNLLKYSEQFDNAAWSKSFCTVTANAATDPNGNTYADKICEDNTTNVHQILQGVAAVTLGNTYQVSVYLKQAERTWAFVQVSSVLATGGAGVYFDLANGVIGSTTGSGIAPTITPAGNGFYLCTFSFVSIVNGSGNLFVVPTTANNVQNYLGVTGNGIYAWGVMVTAGAGGYLPTAGTAVTATQAGLSTTSGTILALGVPYGRTGAPATNTYVVSSGGTPLEMDTSGQWYRGVSAGGSSVTETAGALTVLALTWSNTADKTISYNAGSQLGTATIGQANTPQATVTTPFIGSQTNNTAQYNGWVWLGYWHNQALSALKISTITKASKLRQ